MPRYFFDIRAGEHDLDDEGTEFANFETARSEAIKLAGAYVSDNPRLLGPNDGMIVELLDEFRVPLFRLIMHVQDLRA